MAALIVGHERPTSTTNHTVFTGIITSQTQAH